MGKVARWIAILSEFNITTSSHIKGTENTIPDILSRMEDANIETNYMKDSPLACNNLKSSVAVDKCKKYGGVVKTSKESMKIGSVMNENGRIQMLAAITRRGTRGRQHALGHRRPSGEQS